MPIPDPRSRRRAGRASPRPRRARPRLPAPLPVQLGCSPAPSSASPSCCWSASAAPLVAAASPWTKLVQGAVFGIALTLVVFAGAELFTGNVMVMLQGLVARQVPGRRADRRCWVASLVGNFVGSVGVRRRSCTAAGTLDRRPGRRRSIAARSIVQAKDAATGRSCSGGRCSATCSCASALWMATRTRSDAAKLVVLWWALLAFIASGFEHSIANMTTSSPSAMLEGSATWGHARPQPGLDDPRQHRRRRPPRRRSPTPGSAPGARQAACSRSQRPPRNPPPDPAFVHFPVTATGQWTTREILAHGKAPDCGVFSAHPEKFPGEVSSGAVLVRGLGERPERSGPTERSTPWTRSPPPRRPPWRPVETKTRTGNGRQLWKTGAVAGVAAAAVTTAFAAALEALGVRFEIGGEAIPLLGFAQMIILATIIGTILAVVARPQGVAPPPHLRRHDGGADRAVVRPRHHRRRHGGTRLTLALSHVVAAAIVIPALASKPLRLTP